MQIIVIAGGLASGKSTAANHFRAKGATVISLDEESRVALDANPEMRAAIEDAFPGVYREDGTIDRDALASRCFATPETLKVINGIMHPIIARQVGEHLRELRLGPHQPQVVVIEVPLLAEAPTYAGLADHVITLEAPQEIRLARAESRGFSAEDFRRRVALQVPDSARRELADFVIDTSGDEADFLARLDEIWDECLALPDASGDSK